MSSKKLLVVGGSRMLGRNFVESCLRDKTEYTVYTANRGITNPNLFTCTNIIIDRSSQEQCKTLQEFDKFDIVVDFSCYTADHLYNVITNIKYDRYYFISSSAVENEDVLQDSSHSFHEYARHKAHVESYIHESFKEKATIIRPCIIYGPNDYSNRFYEKDNKFYRKEDNTEVVNDKYHIHVKDFIKRLMFVIDNDIKETINITGIDDKYNVHPSESKYISVKQYDYPFNHVVIDNLFDRKTYQKMCDMFPKYIERTIPYKDQEGATSDYEGYILGLGLSDLVGGFSLFGSKYLQNFVEKQFDIKTNKFIAPSAHFHRTPSKDGFIHRDYNIVSFKDRADNEFVATGDAFYTDDTNKNPESTKVIRSIALLYYLNNDDNIDCTGGGTGIYEGYDGKLIKTIEPKNNRLLIFEMTHNSYHGFIGANFDRSCLVSWFHSSPAYMINRHWKEYKVNPQIVERWSHINMENYWQIESDPEYNKYFNKTLAELT